MLKSRMKDVCHPIQQDPNRYFDIQSVVVFYHFESQVFLDNGLYKVDCLSRRTYAPYGLNHQKIDEAHLLK